MRTMAKKVDGGGVVSGQKRKAEVHGTEASREKVQDIVRSKIIESKVSKRYT